MARYTGPKIKQCRREGMNLFFLGQNTSSGKVAVLQRRDYPPGVHAQSRRKVTEYGVRLREKQKLKRVFGVLERQFKRYFTEAERMKGNTGENLLVLLERRLDNVVLNLGLALSRFDARQMIAHGHVFVRGRRMSVPSYLVRPGDDIEVRGKFEDPEIRLTPLKTVVRPLGSLGRFFADVLGGAEEDEDEQQDAGGGP